MYIMSWYHFKLFLLELALIVGLGYTGAMIIKKLNGGIDMKRNENKKVRYIVGVGVMGIFFVLRAIFEKFL